MTNTPYFDQQTLPAQERNVLKLLVRQIGLCWLLATGQ
jgi:hypothetical protein